MANIILNSNEQLLQLYPWRDSDTNVRMHRIYDEKNEIIV